MSVPRLHVITSDAILADSGFIARAATVLEAGPLALHLRGHATSVRALYDIARALVPVARDMGALLIVNDRIDVARAVGADGVQLGVRGIPWHAARPLLPDRVIGASVHGREDALRAEADGTDWLILGTIYATASHPGAVLLGEAGVAAIAAEVMIPVLAIGGVRPEYAAGLLAAGAHGAAVLSGVWQAARPADAVRTFLDALAAATTREEGQTWTRSG